MPAPICNKKYKLQKFPGKGGWTYALIPEATSGKQKINAFTKVYGSIDGHEITSTTLMSMGERRYFIPVNAGIRKKIGKQEGDWVTIVLYLMDAAPSLTDEDFTDCLKDEPAAWQHYQTFPKAEQQAWMRWVSEPADEKVRVERIAAAVNRIAKGLRFS